MLDLKKGNTKVASSKNDDTTHGTVWKVGDKNKNLQKKEKCWAPFECIRSKLLCACDGVNAHAACVCECVCVCVCVPCSKNIKHTLFKR